MFIKDISLEILFLVISLSGFDIRVLLASYKEFQSFPLLHLFGRVCEGWIYISDKIPVSHQFLGFPFMEGFFIIITDSISLLIIGPFRLSISS
jgi:hypothetical protein